MSTAEQPVRSWAAQMQGPYRALRHGRARDGEAYGYQILQRLSRAEALTISESAVYPILARLAADGLVKVRVGPSPNGPPRRYYKLTPREKPASPRWPTIGGKPGKPSIFSSTENEHE